MSSASNETTNRCVLMVVDALAEPIVRQWVESAMLPAISTLLARGGSVRPCLSIFPSITPAATCSIGTGVYPKDHGIEGACWFDPVKNDAAYYGDDLSLALQEGLRNYLVDFGDRLNFERLRAPLIYEHLHDAGLESACINYMWFRGPHEHFRKTPFWLRMASGALPTKVKGPKYLKLGDFVHSLPEAAGNVSGMTSGLLGRYGFHDATTAACAMAMARSGSLPPMTLAYFPLNDDRGHKQGLHEAASVCLESFDSFLAEFVEAIGGWDLVGDQYTLMIVGDHGQSEWSDQGPNIVRLDSLLQDFTIGDTTAGLRDGDQILICPNMRSAAIYISDESCRGDVIKKLSDEDGIDQIIYQEDRPDHVKMITVETKDRGRVSFTRARASSADLPTHGTDLYGNRWSIFGELSAVDLRFEPDGTIVDGVYPNALERIEGAFTGGPSPIWVTAKPKVELAIRETSAHEGGSHGSLHRDDSISTLIASADVDFSTLPNATVPRIVDVMGLCLRSLGVSSHQQRFFQAGGNAVASQSAANPAS